MHLVVGATGHLGTEICRRLRAVGKDVRALVRPSTDFPAALELLGVELARGDLRDPASLVAACRGVAIVVSTATAIARPGPRAALRDVDRDGQIALVAAARQAGAERFVFVSVSPGLTERSPLVRYKRVIERALERSGLAWAALQPSAFMEVWLGPIVGFTPLTGRVSVFGSGARPATFVSAGDVAALTLAAATRADLAGRIPFGGPDAVSPLDVVRLYEQRLGQPIAVKRVPTPGLFLGNLLLRGADPVQASRAGLALDIALGRDVARTAEAVRAVLPRPTSVAAYVDRTVA